MTFDALLHYTHQRSVLLTLGGMAGLGICGLGGMDAITVNTHLQFAALCGGIALLVMGLITNPTPISLATPMPRASVYFALTLILLLAFGVRIINLENAVHNFVDETNFVEGVVNLRDDPNASLLRPMGTIASFPHIFAYLQLHTTYVFGPTLTALRMVSALFGTLTVAAVYLLASTWFDRRIALLAALMLATLPPHIHMSRLGLNNIADPLFGVLALAYMARALKGGRHADWVLAGAMLGLTQYWYEGGKLLYPALVICWLGGLVLAAMWGRFSATVTPSATHTHRSLAWRQVLLMGITAIIVAAPVYSVAASTGTPGTPRLRSMAISGESWYSRLLAADGTAEAARYLGEQLIPAWDHFISRPDGSEIYYGGDTALILPYLVPFFVLGLLILLRRGQLVIPLWILLTVLGNSLIGRPDWSARFAVALPAIPLVMAVGMVWLWDAYSKRKHTAKPIPRFAIQAIVVMLLGTQIVYYFGPHLTRYNMQIRPFRDHQDVGWRARDLVQTLDPNTRAYLFTDELTFMPHIWLMERYWQVDLHVWFLHPLEILLRDPGDDLPTGSSFAFFVRPGDRETLHQLAQSFELDGPYNSPYNIPDAREYLLYLAVHPAPALSADSGQ